MPYKIYNYSQWKNLSIKYDRGDDRKTIFAMLKKVYQYLKSNNVLRDINNNVTIIFSNAFTNDIQQLMKREEDSSCSALGAKEPNAQFISHESPFCEEEKDIIVINNAKLKKTNTVWQTGVIVHEMVHYFDYQYVELLAKNFQLEPYNDEQGTPKNILFAFFQMHSEMRAKYYQEKICMPQPLDMPFAQYVDQRYTQLKGENDWYSMAHQWGQLLYWNTIYGVSINKQQLIKEKCVDIYKTEPLTIFLPLHFEWNSFVEFASYYYEHHTDLEENIESYLNANYSAAFWWNLIKQAKG